MENKAPKIAILAVDIFPDHSNAKKTMEWVEGMQEWESQKSIDILKETLSELGYEVRVCSQPFELLKSLENCLSMTQLQNNDSAIAWNDHLNSINLFPYNRIPLVWNLVEGYKSRNREGYIPSLCEFLGIPSTGSDSYAQAISLDKYIMKQMIPNSKLIPRSSILPKSIQSFELPFYPCFIKPRGEGSGIGVDDDSLIRELGDWENWKSNLDERYKKSEEWICEEYLPGKEYTVCLIQELDLTWKAVSAEIQYPHQFYGEEIKRKDSMPETFHLNISDEKKKILEENSISIMERIGGEGYARLDWKEDIDGTPKFLEANLTPGLSMIYSLYPKIMIESTNIEYNDLIDKICNVTWVHYLNKKRYQYGINQRKFNFNPSNLLAMNSNNE